MNSDTSFDINTNSNPVQTVAQPKEDNEMLRATDRITALYCRLSVEDTKDEKKNGKENQFRHPSSLIIGKKTTFSPSILTRSTLSSLKFEIYHFRP